MIRKSLLVLSLGFAGVCFGLQVGDTVTPGRVVDGNLVSDAVEDGESPIFGDVFDPITTDINTATIRWSPVVVDSDGNPITLYNYEIRYRIVGQTEYSVIIVPANYAGVSNAFSVGSYEGYVEAVASDGWISPRSNFTFEVQ